MELLRKLYDMTAIGELINEPTSILMLIIGCFLLYLGIKKQYEPLLLVPIAFGILLANFPGGQMGVVKVPDDMELLEIAREHGIMNFVYYALIKTGFLPPIIFMGVGALTDFGPMLRNLRLAFFGAAAQIGIFTVLISAVAIGFTMKEAAALGIIGGADGPTAIYTTIKLAPHLLGPIAIAAYSYMALVPVIIPLVVRFTMTESELKINMKKMDKLYPDKQPIKNLQTLKIMFPIGVGSIVAILVPSSVPLLGLLMFGNLVKEIGV
ncbi:MAG: sodium ion-translocating decarboxylase subunit beta, partial [Bacteroidota bacterium]